MNLHTFEVTIKSPQSVTHPAPASPGPLFSNCTPQPSTFILFQELMLFDSELPPLYNFPSCL